MPRSMLAILATLWPSLALASGWHDYSLTIDPGYEIVRANSLDVGLCKTGGSVILMPQYHPGLGPIYEYAVTPSFIFTRHYGRAPRNLFAGDTFEDVDTSKVLLCIVRKSDDRVTGPFDQNTFNSQSDVVNAGSFAWKQPSNPNIVTPIVGTIFFLVASAIILGWPIIVMLGLAAVLLLLLKRRVRGGPAAG